MGKKVKVGKQRKDKFYQLAKETGFRSRASFKLIQLNRRFNFLGNSKVLIDLCAAPGSWLQVATKEMPVNSKIIGVDLVPIQPLPRVKTFTADITTDKCRILLKNELNGLKADVLLNDGAPNVGAAWSVDEYNQAQLCLQSFALATEFLRKGGWFITKVFRSKDYEPLRWVLNKFFKSVKCIKPEASRLESAEIFLVGQHYIAPDKIDPKFLDQKHVFSEVDAKTDKKEIMARLKKTIQKRRAIGYDEGDSLYKEVSIMDFIQSKDPLLTMAKATKIILDKQEIRDHPSIDSSIKTYLDDIKVLGKSEIKAVLKWRKVIIDAIEAGKEGDKENNVEEDVEQKEDDSDVDIEGYVSKALEEEKKELKKKMKKMRKVKKKLADRIVMKMELPGDRIERNDDKDLFSLSQIENLESLYETGALIGDTSVTGVDAITVAKNKAENKARELLEQQNLDLAIQGRRTVQYAARGEKVDKEAHWGALGQNNKYIDDDIYLSSSGSSSEDASDNDASDSDAETSDYANTDDSDEYVNVSSKKRKHEETDELSRSVKPKLSSTDTQATDVEIESTRPKKTLMSTNLLVDLDDADEVTKKTEKLKKWCSSSEMKHLLSSYDKDFDNMSEASDVLEEVLSDVEVEVKPKKKKVPNEEAVTDVVESKNVAMESENNISNLLSKATKRLKKLKRPLTPDERALALKLIKSAKSERDLVQWGFHRYRFFEDESQLPDWFVDDERKHMRKALPIDTTSLVARPVQGKTIGKAEEAKARKKKRLVKKLKKVRQKAEQLDDDLPEKEKWDKIKTLYGKAGLLKKKRKPVHFVVNSKGGAKNKTVPKGAKMKVVDRRLKSDSRSRKSGKPTNSKHGKKGRVPVGKKNKAKAGTKKR